MKRSLYGHIIKETVTFAVEESYSDNGTSMHNLIVNAKVTTTQKDVKDAEVEVLRVPYLHGAAIGCKIVAAGTK